MRIYLKSTCVRMMKITDTHEKVGNFLSEGNAIEWIAQGEDA